MHAVEQKAPALWMAGLEGVRLGADLDLRALRNGLRGSDASFRIGR